MVNYLKVSRSDTIHTHFATAITYIYTVTEGWTYLLTYMYLYVRKILAWGLANDMTSAWVNDIAKEEIRNYASVQVHPLRSQKPIHFKRVILCQVLRLLFIVSLLEKEQVLNYPSLQ